MIIVKEREREIGKENSTLLYIQDSTMLRVVDFNVGCAGGYGRLQELQSPSKKTDLLKTVSNLKLLSSSLTSSLEDHLDC